MEGGVGGDLGGSKVFSEVNKVIVRLSLGREVNDVLWNFVVWDQGIYIIWQLEQKVIWSCCLFFQIVRQIERKLEFFSVCDVEDIVGQMFGGEYKKQNLNCRLVSVEKESFSDGGVRREGASRCWFGEV